MVPGTEVEERKNSINEMDGTVDIDQIVKDARRKNLECRSAMFSSVKSALVLFSLAAMLLRLVVSGLYSVVVSTLERRFELRSTETAVIASCFEIAAFLATIFVAFANEDVRKAKWFSRGTFLIGIGGILFALPHFVAPFYSPSNADSFNYCGNVTTPKCTTPTSIRGYRYIFSLSTGLMGVGSGFQHAYAISYLDENLSKDDSAFFNAIHYAMIGLGAAIGFIAGAASLNHYTYVTMRIEDMTIDSSNDLWVGAWWLGFILSGIVTLLIAIPIYMFPRHLPGTERFLENRDSEMQRNIAMEDAEGSRSFIRKKSDVIILLKNKPFVLITLATAVNLALVLGFNTFGAKYLEAVFGATTFQASLIYGSCVVVATLAGQIAGGYFIKRMSLTVRGIIKFVIAGGVFSAVSSLGFLLYCSEVDIAGATVPYPNATYAADPNSQCNMNCGCSTDLYLPVCSEETIYFSPCFAGCTEKINETTYGSCSCVRDRQVVSTTGCNRRACPHIYPFAVIICFCMFSSVLTVAPALQITLRCVAFDKRVLALALQRLVILSMGVIPGRLLVGFVMDLACVTWGTDCGEKGSCRAYWRRDVSRNNTLLLVAQTTTCAILYILVYVFYEPVGSTVVPDEDIGRQQKEIERLIAGSIHGDSVDASDDPCEANHAIVANRPKDVNSV